jgi:hypothetical protein
MATLAGALAPSNEQGFREIDAEVEPDAVRNERGAKATCAAGQIENTRAFQTKLGREP